MTNQHGDDYQGELKANFSSNMWYGADNTALYEHLSTRLNKTVRYPEQNAESLKSILGKIHSLKPDQISIGNGSIDIIYRVAQAYYGKKSIIVSPTFSEYAKACEVNRHEIRTCKPENLHVEMDTFQPDLVWICNPNNPDGTCLDKKHLQDLILSYPLVNFIIDQSFADFTLQETLAGTSVSEQTNLMLIYSLTKRYSIPGLRIGYVLASIPLINQLDRYKIPWSVNTLAIEAGNFLLSTEDKSPDLKAWLTDAIHFQDAINRIGIFETLPSLTPFFMVKLLKGKSACLKTFLLKEDILIRDANNFEYGIGEFIRLNTLSESENNLLIEKLIEWKNTL